MHCSFHGEVEEPIAGRCPSCLKAEILSELERLASDKISEGLGTGQFPLAQIPLFPLRPEDIPCLWSRNSNQESVETLRNMIAATYWSAGCLFADEHVPESTLTATQLAWIGAEFSPSDDVILFDLYHLAGGTQKDFLNLSGDLTKEVWDDETVDTLRSIACDFHLALRHLSRVKDVSLVSPDERRMAMDAREFLKAMRALEYFDIVEGRLLSADHRRDHGSVEEFSSVRHWVEFRKKSKQLGHRSS
jgi:hypothetical protein